MRPSGEKAAPHSLHGAALRQAVRLRGFPPSVAATEIVPSRSRPSGSAARTPQAASDPSGAMATSWKWRISSWESKTALTEGCAAGEADAAGAASKEISAKPR